jgi:hypothetical protein
LQGGRKAAMENTVLSQILIKGFVVAEWEKARSSDTTEQSCCSDFDSGDNLQIYLESRNIGAAHNQQSTSRNACPCIRQETVLRMFYFTILTNDNR